MAMEKPVELESGVEVEGAYWTPAHYHMDIIGRGGNIIFYAHASKAAHAAGKAPLSGTMKSYPFTSGQFAAATVKHQVELFPEYKTLTLHDTLPDLVPADHPLAGVTVAQVLFGIKNPASMPILYNVLGRFIYGHAKTFKDVPAKDDEGKPLLDEDGKPVLRSFFEGAQDV